MRYSYNNVNIRSLTLTALMTAIICILSPITLPIGIIPVSLSNLAIYLTILLLGKKKSMAAVLLYLLIGFTGIPVYSGFSAGAGKLMGPTGGYLIGYIFLVWAAGWILEKQEKESEAGSILALCAGTAFLYLFGTSWLAFSANLSLQAAFTSGVLPFILPDLFKIGIAVGLAKAVKKRLKHVEF